MKTGKRKSVGSKTWRDGRVVAGLSRFELQLQGINKRKRLGMTIRGSGRLEGDYQ